MDFRGHIFTFQVENRTIIGGCFEAENNAQTTSEQLQTNFQKHHKTACLTLKMVKMTLSEGQILTYNFDFSGHISTFQAKNTPKNQAFKAKNNA